MSTKALRAVLRYMRKKHGPGVEAAEAELEAIERAAKDPTRLHVADFTDDIAHRDNVVSAMTTPESQWDHPDVTAWGDAAVLLESIAKDAPK